MKTWIQRNSQINTQFAEINPQVQIILNHREVFELEEMKEFLSDKPVRTYDPFLLKGMEEGVQLILNTINKQKKICIYGDYDVDGVTATCLMYELLSQITQEHLLMWYIPSRFDEGYGLNKEALKSICEDGVDLVITVDCGSVSYEEVEYAKQIGLQIIITDHHNLGMQKPDCIMINPKQEDCEYPFKGLCGCGVAFKVAQAIQRRIKGKKNMISELLDLVAIGTIADIVPLVDENRTIVKFGLKALNKRKRLGLKMLMEAISLGEKVVNSYDVGFGIGPHINAGGRVESAKTGLFVLLHRHDDQKEALEQLVNKLVENNQKRRKLQTEAYEKCVKYIGDNTDKYFIVITDHSIHEGIAGIVAGKLKDKYQRPVVVMTKAEEANVLKGTGRSILGIDLHQVLSAESALFLKFGGHAAACGFSIKEEQEEELRQALEYEGKNLFETDAGIFEEKLYYEGDLTEVRIGLELAHEVERLEPFGHRNEKPLFIIRAVTIEKLFFMGEEKQHIKLKLKTKKGDYIEAVQFGVPQDEKIRMKQGSMLDIAGSVGVNRWNGMETLQIIISDVRFT